MFARSMALTLVAIAGSCLAAEAVHAGHRSRTHDEFIASVGRFPYAAGNARVQKIRVGVPALQYCMSAAQVVEIMGEPDFSYIQYRKGTRDVPAMTVLTYVLAQQAETERETDQRIIVWMGVPDELHGVSAWGIRGLTGLEGSAGLQCH
jgi:hypothetical protein